MTYNEIRALANSPKSSCKHMGMTITHFDRFSVMSTDKTPAIIVDRDIAEKVANRRWCLDSHGYPVANFNNNLIRLFDYVMAQDNEEKPLNCYVDHINRDRLDNRRINLRFVTSLENTQNKTQRSDNCSGVTGVCKAKGGRYRAYITINRKQIGLGCYDTLLDAQNARLEAESRLHFGVPRTVKDICEMALAE